MADMVTLETYREMENRKNKRIEELEKENAELKAKLEKETNHRIQNFNKAIEWKEKHRELKKENAELKSEKGCETCTKFDEVKLTKAKGIIEKLISDNHKVWVCSDVREEAEQFLKEIEK